MSYFVAALIVGGVFCVGAVMGYRWNDRQWTQALDSISDEPNLVELIEERRNKQ